MDNNIVNVSGCVETEFVFDHEFCGECFYKMIISIERDSGTKDKLPVMVSDRLFDVSQKIANKNVFVHGEFRSHNQKNTDKIHILLFIFALDVYLTDDSFNKNEISIDGFICKKPSFRETPFGRKISDLIVAVNRPYGRCDYIPCICWGRNAHYASRMNVGDQIQITGRIQSREYTKNIDGVEESRTAYEVSVKEICELCQ